MSSSGTAAWRWGKNRSSFIAVRALVVLVAGWLNATQVKSAAPTCLGKPATITGSTGRELTAASGNDVILLAAELIAIELLSLGTNGCSAPDQLFVASDTEAVWELAQHRWGCPVSIR
jgi:hypothetical protein